MRTHAEGVVTAIVAALRRATPGLAVLAAACFARAARGQTISEFPLPTLGAQASGLTLGPDGNLWFTEYGQNKIGRVNPGGSMTEFAVPTTPGLPRDITVGVDGNLWFTEVGGNQIGRITPSGVISEFPVPTADAVLNGIVAGPDGNLWFTEGLGNNIGRVTTAGVITEFAVPTANAHPDGITAGPDGNIWFTEVSGNRIGRVSTTGSSMTEFIVPTAASGPTAIVAALDGTLWFTEAAANQLGQVNTSGGFLEEAVPTASAGLSTIAVGGDGNLWFTEIGHAGNAIGRVVGYVITEFAVPTVNAKPDRIVKGADGNLWFTEGGGAALGRLSLIREIPVPTANADLQGITTGSDARMWFTEADVDKIGRLATVGPSLPPDEIPVPTPASGPWRIAPGPGGNMWFTEESANKVARLTIAGGITEFALAANTEPTGITAGSDGNMWFAEIGEVGRIKPSGAMDQFPVLTAGAQVSGITAGSDGNLWFTEPFVGNIGRITTTGDVAEFPVPILGTFPLDITAGPDGNLWFTDVGVNAVGRITPAGVVIEFPIPAENGTPSGIVSGPDGNLWVGELWSEIGMPPIPMHSLARITTAGVSTEFVLPTPTAGPQQIALGPDGNLWFTESSANNVGRLTPPATTLTPSSGPAAGGTAVTIAGTGFVDGVTLTVGSAAAGDVVYVGPTRLTATIPSLAAGTLNDLKIGKPDGSINIGPGAWLSDFADVSQADPFHAFVEAVFRHGITAGCGQGDYCRNNAVTRAQMAVFLLRAEHGSHYTPPPCTGIFADVECTPTPAFAVDWIEQLSLEGITGGCGGGHYCPNNPVTRAQMAVFLLKTEHGSSYTPPACTGIFSDVECMPIPAFAVNWIEQLFHEGVTGGCGGGDYCPSNPNTRGQMAVFLVKTFGPQLQGP